MTEIRRAAEEIISSRGYKKNKRECPCNIPSDFSHIGCFLDEMSRPVCVLSYDGQIPKTQYTNLSKNNERAFFTIVHSSSPSHEEQLEQFSNINLVSVGLIDLNPTMFSFGPSSYRIVKSKHTDSLSGKLPIYSYSDPIVKYIGARHGDVIEILRTETIPSQLVASSLYLRQVTIE